MTTDSIFQLTDLANNRSEVVAAARGRGARLRDKDGTGLVMLTENRVHLLEELARWNLAHLRLENLFRRSATPSVSELGELAWLRVFDHEDQLEFLSDLHDALVSAHADESVAVLDACVHEWRVTAQQLEDPLRRSILMRESIAADELEEADRPDGQ